MLLIRRIQDDTMLSDQRAIEQVQVILKSRFPDVREKYSTNIPEQLTNPLKYRFRTSLLIAENRRGTVQGFSLMYFAPDLRFCFLDFIASGKNVMSGGIGTSLYESTRQEAIKLRARGLFFECLPDEASVCLNTALIEQNKARLRFYEHFGAFPLINTQYETPVTPAADQCPPYLVCDFLGQPPVSRAAARKIIRAILERKYEDIVTEDYISTVVDSIKDDPVKLRAPRYVRPPKPEQDAPALKKLHGTIYLAVNDRHSIHHVRDRGYVESPVRISTILSELNATGLFKEMHVHTFSEKYIREVHDHGFINYFKRVCESLPEGKSIYPYVFPVRNPHKAPSDDSVLAGYYCIDTFTPLNKNAYLAARRAVDCALSGAARLLSDARAVYALVRPPGHHAERKVFGGFCYFNSAAIAAHFLSRYGKVAMLDIDYHHGNGQQDIFYARKDVLTLSIHGHPSFAYPYFTGFADEKGEGEGTGFNINYPLKERTTGEEYSRVLGRALVRISRFNPGFRIVLLGLDTAKGDPTGTWNLTAGDFYRNGMEIGKQKIPTLFVQEGGYKNRVLGINARNFFQGFYETFFNG
ncbi:MAG: histone deacetylase family protein [Bacteroidales bacterium]|nr:histone deacetylase family protein [Bacteroidales bacterium]